MATVVQLQHRKSQCWITSFVEATDHLDSPPLFRKWAALSALSAAVERKIYLTVQHRRLFANLYVFLVSPPGIGKTTAIIEARKLLHTIPRLMLAPAKVTKEKFLDLCTQAMKTDADLDTMTHTSFNCFLDEVSTFITPHDVDFAILLTDLYDCPDHWQYSLISRRETIFEHVYLTILGAITPRMIAESLGQRSLGLGFTSRIIFIYSEDATRKPLFPKTKAPDVSHLKDDLVKAHELRGPYTLSQEAETEVEKWVSAGMPPIPNDSRFAEYLPRRARHWLKIAMLVAAGRRDRKEVLIEDLEFARELLLEAEETMPLALEAVGQNPMVDAMQRTQRWALIQYATNGKQPLHESLIRKKLLQDIAPNYLEQTVHAMLTSGQLVHSGGTYPNRLFSPTEHKRE